MRQPMPTAYQPLVGPGGQITQAWQSYLQQFVLPPSSIETITVGASPFTYTASETGTLRVIGGTVSGITWTRGTNTIAMPTNGLIPMSQKDSVVVTYSVMPTLIWIPS